MLTVSQLTSNIHVKPNVTIRPVELRDLQSLEDLAILEGWDIGLHNLQLYYTTSPQGWFLAETPDGQIVAYDSYNCLSNGIHCGYQLIVRSDYRGKGVTRMFNTMNYASFPGFGNATADSLKRYSSLSIITWKLIGFDGVIWRQRIPKITANIHEKIVPLSTNNFKSLCDYDRDILSIDRSVFMRQYALPEDPQLAKCLVVEDSKGVVRGYGVLRLCSDYHSISPVYADTADMAMMLLTSLCRLLPESASVHIPFHAESSTTLTFCHQLGLSQCTSEVRAYRSDAFENLGKQLKLDRVYAVQEFWPL